MTSKADKIRAGVFTAIAAALVAVVLVVFGGWSLWRRHDHYRIVFPGSVMGLDEGAQVYLAGIRVGTVSSIDVSPDDLGKVVVAIAVDHGTPIRADTQAHLDYAGITGLKVIDLQGGTYGAPPVREGGTIAAGQGVIEKLQHKAELLVDQSDSIMKRANQIVDNLVTITDPSRFAAVGRALAQADLAATDLAATAHTLRAMVGEDRALVAQSLAAVRDTAASAGRLAASGDDLIAQIRTFVLANEGPVRGAIFDLRQASRSFKELARDVRQRPSELLFSSAPAERKLP